MWRTIHLILCATAACFASAPSIPLTFQPNVGQSESSVKFLGGGSDYAVAFAPQGFVLSRHGVSFRVDFAGSDPAVKLHGAELESGRANYLIGAEERWIRNVPLYARLEYEGVYPGVNLVFHGAGRELEYDFTLASWAQISQIRLRFGPATGISIVKGDLVVKTPGGEVRQHRPRVSCLRNGSLIPAAGRFVLRGPAELGFAARGCRPDDGLLIDPVFTYATYIGGAGSDQAYALAVDSTGASYIAGETWPVNFPSTVSISSSSGNDDAFLVKLNPASSAIVYATYFGGQSRDSARGVAIDSAGNAYVTGFTYSPDFPLTQAGYRSPSLGQSDVFVTKINAAGSGLVYSALIGGPGNDFGTGVAVDSSGNAYVSGYTSSVAFPVTAGCFQGIYGGGLQDAFVAKLNTAGSALVFATYLGGTGNDLANALAVDSLGNVYVTGYTDSVNWPVANALYPNPAGQGDSFLAKLAAAGNSLIFSTYFGGEQLDSGTAIALDSAGNVYVAGTTLSSAFPVTAGALQSTNHGSYDAFAAKWNGQGTALRYSTYLGGEGADEASAIAVDSNGFAYVAGTTWSFGFPVSNPVQGTIGGGSDAFVAALGINGASLAWSTYLGGAGDDQATAVAVDSTGAVHLAGLTYSSNFPTTLGALRTVASGADGFAVTLSPGVASIISPVPGTTLSGTTVAFSWNVIPSATAYWLDVGTAQGSGNLCAGATSGSQAACSAIPAEGQPVYVQLWTYVQGGWKAPVRYSYTAPILASMVAPAINSTFSASLATFSWTAAPGADDYWLDVGTARGLGDLCGLATAATQYTCANLPVSGQTIYVQLWTHMGGAWQSPIEYVYTAYLVPSAQLTSPANHSTLSGASVTFTWTSTPGADAYWLDVGTSPGQGNICALSTAATQYTCLHIPTNAAPVYVQLFTHISGAWRTPLEYSFTAY